MVFRSRFASVALMTVLLVAGAAAAQTGSDEWTEIQSLRADIKADRQNVVAENMTLGQTEAEPFWALYREYHLQLDKLGDRSTKLILNYAKTYEKLTDAEAELFFKEWLSIEQERVKLRADYSKKFIKIVGAKKAARYFQIENKLDTVVNLGLAAEIPLMP